MKSVRSYINNLVTDFKLLSAYSDRTSSENYRHLGEQLAQRGLTYEQPVTASCISAKLHNFRDPDHPIPDTWSDTVYPLTPLGIQRRRWLAPFGFVLNRLNQKAV